MTRLSALARRIDALATRERLFLFLSLALLLLAGVDRWVLTPSLNQQSVWRASAQRNEAELATMRQQLLSLNQQRAQPTGQIQQLQADLVRLGSLRDALQHEQSPATGSDAAPDLPTLLSHVLKRYPRVQIVQLATTGHAELPSTARSVRAEGSAASPTAAPLGSTLAISGPYADLQSFLVALETALPALRWGELQLLQAGDLPLLVVQLWLPGAAP